MAIIRSVKMENGEIILSLSITDEEYKFISGAKEVIIATENFDEFLTTGKLGNSNRIMLPKKILKKHGIELRGKVPAIILKEGGRKFLLIKIDEKKKGVPKFEE
ncbi:hypothetical protein DRQ26_01380 [bacterium]|nr:MAG: hypothetical protein DRQ26_01380 [bacterium]